MAVIFTPPGASSLNPIERAWGILKNIWRRELVRLGTEVKHRDIEFFR